MKIIKNHVETMRTKTPSEKSHYAFLASLTITGIIAGVWFLLIFANPTEYFDVEKDELQQLANTGSLFDSLKAGFK